MRIHGRHSLGCWAGIETMTPASSPFDLSLFYRTNTFRTTPFCRSVCHTSGTSTPKSSREVAKLAISFGGSRDGVSGGVNGDSLVIRAESLRNRPEKTSRFGERPTLVKPKAPVVVSAEKLDGLNHSATLYRSLVIPTDGKAELRMKSRRPLP